MINTYIPRPNLSTAPPPDGPIDLGHILRKPSDLYPLNRRCRVPIQDDDKEPVHKKLGYRATRKELLSASLGLCGRFVGMVGIGFEAGVAYGKESDDIFNIDTLETSTFIATDEYVKNSIDTPAVRIVLEAAKYKTPLYMITGMKVARGVSLESRRHGQREAKLRIGFDAPGVTVDAGPQVTKAGAGDVSFEGSDDFIIALRMEKIEAKRVTVSHKFHTAGASMYDGDAKEDAFRRVEFSLNRMDQGEVKELANKYGYLVERGDRDVEEEDTVWLIPDVVDG